jgi:VIT1/CCC1 family predicted Fe2+/Mn2+ transporter
MMQRQRQGRRWRATSRNLSEDRSRPAGIEPEQLQSHEFREHHRDVQGGAIRAAIFGVSDGLVSNASLILGVAGADVDGSVVRLAGLAGLLAGAFSMAAGEYVSMAAQAELLARELEVERKSLAEDPEYERAELTAIYERRGLDHETARELSERMMRDDEMALEVHAREEIGVDPNQLGSPYAAAGSSFAAFAVGGLVPLVPWFVLEGDVAILASIVLAALTAIGVGAAIGLSTGRSVLRASVRQLAIGTVAGAVTYASGALLGVQVT